MFVHDKSILEALLVGTTHTLDLGGGAQASVYYGVAGEARMLAPDGGHRVGKWAISSGGYHVDWEGGASADWQIDLEPGRIAYCDGAGTERGTVLKIVPGNALMAA